MNNNYFDNENRLMPHGVMFHHFHDDGGRPYTQGSITSEQFQKIIEHIDNQNEINQKLLKCHKINENICQPSHRKPPDRGQVKNELKSYCLPPENQSI